MSSIWLSITLLVFFYSLVTTEEITKSDVIFSALYCLVFPVVIIFSTFLVLEKIVQNLSLKLGGV